MARQREPLERGCPSWPSSWVRTRCEMSLESRVDQPPSERAPSRRALSASGIPADRRTAQRLLACDLPWITGVRVGNMDNVQMINFSSTGVLMQCRVRLVPGQETILGNFVVHFVRRPGPDGRSPVCRAQRAHLRAGTSRACHADARSHGAARSGPDAAWSSDGGHCTGVAGDRFSVRRSMTQARTARLAGAAPFWI